MSSRTITARLVRFGAGALLAGAVVIGPLAGTSGAVNPLEINTPNTPIPELCAGLKEATHNNKALAPVGSLLTACVNLPI